MVSQEYNFIIKLKLDVSQKHGHGLTLSLPSACFQSNDIDCSPR